MEKIIIAKVLKPQALKGELKLELFFDDEKFLKNLKEIFIDDKAVKVLSCAVRQGFGYMMLEGIDDCNKAEGLRNKELSVPRELMPSLNENEFLIGDMMGLTVVDDFGTEWGRVVSIEQYGSADVYTLHGKKGEITFPFLKTLIKQVDLNNKKIIVFKDKFNEVIS